MAKTRVDKTKPVRKARPKVPPYVKPFAEFRKAVKKGDMVSLQCRRHDERGFSFKEVFGTVKEIAPKVIVIDTEKWPVPWWSIHDWEIGV